MLALVHDLEDVQEDVNDIQVEYDGSHNVAVFVNLVLSVLLASAADDQLRVVNKEDSEEDHSDAGKQVVHFWSEKHNE